MPDQVIQKQERCGTCKNCLDLERVRARVLACVNPPFTHADNSIVELWNRELSRLHCLNTNPHEGNL